MSEKELQTVSASEVGTLEENLPGIIDPKTFSVPAVTNPYEDDFGAFTTGMFLPRLQLEGSSSNLVKQRKVAAGSWIIVTGKDQFEDLGDQIDVLVLTYRSKALDLSNKKKILASFDKDSTLFKSIVAASQHKSKGFMYGLEFLVFIPNSKGEMKFATLFMGNPTMRQEAKNFKPLLRTASNPRANNLATLKVKLISNAEYTWEAPVILPNTSGLSSYPSQEEMATQMAMFIDTPVDSQVQEVAAEEAEAAGVGDERGN